jgi:hypothetical protein
VISLGKSSEWSSDPLRQSQTLANLSREVERSSGESDYRRALGAAVGISARSFAVGPGVFTPESPADREHAATTANAQSARSTRFTGLFLRQGGLSTGQHPRSDQLESG